MFEADFRGAWLGQAQMPESERDRLVRTIESHVLIAERLDRFMDDMGAVGLFEALGEDTYRRLEAHRTEVLDRTDTVASVYERLIGPSSGWWALTGNETDDLETWMSALEEMERIVLIAQGKNIPNGAPPTSGDMSIPVGAVALGGLAAAVGVFLLLLG